MAKKILGTEGDDSLSHTGFHSTVDMYGFGGNDALWGGINHDRLFGGDGNDNLSAGRNNDYLDGGAGIDRLSGGPGDDVLIGGASHDHMTGGPGADLYIFHPGDSPAAAPDVITDFLPGTDTLDIGGAAYSVSHWDSLVGPITNVNYNGTAVWLYGDLTFTAGDIV